MNENTIVKLLDNRYDYDYAIKHRLEISNTTFEINGEPYTIQLLVSNGFVKLYSLYGRVYWVSQVQTAIHQTPDWKIHFSVDEKSIRNTFNIVASCYIKTKQKFPKKGKTFFFGMKAINIKLISWPKNMTGREVTVYIYKYDSRLNSGQPFTLFSDENTQLNSNEVKKVIYKKEDEEDNEFIFSFIKLAEKELFKNGIKIQGCADGDLWLGNYSSLRNEAYVYINDNPTYPPNSYGWNAAKQKVPFSWFEIWKLRSQINSFTYAKIKNRIIVILFFVISIFILIFVVFFSIK